MSQPYPIAAFHGDNTLSYEPGWLVLTRELGADPTDRNGENFRRFPHRKIVRLNHGYGDQGTIPLPDRYADFATRCMHFVEFSAGCSRWIIGNEPNMEVERPEGVPITPERYAECYTLCREAIRSLKYNTGDQVLLAAIAPWNVQTGDWIEYFERIQHVLPAGGCDGFIIHAYWREQTATSVTSSTKMQPPHEDRFWSFRHYMNWMAAILPKFQGLPVYLTEMCTAGEAWENVDTGCVQAAYAEIDGWNRLSPDRAISCAALYRWKGDKWAIDDKPMVHQDFYAAVARGYTVPADGNPTEPPEEDMLQNPSFEEGWYQQGGEPRLTLPDHWVAEYLEGGDPWYRPEIKPNEEFTTDGQFSIRAFQPEHSQGFFGIYQELDAVPGQWYKFSADVRLESKPPGELAGFAGIQPWGASIFERQMIWGKETQVQIEWQRVEVIAQAFGNRIRVAMGATSKWATRNNTTWWDNAKLELYDCDGGGTEPPVEPPEPGECNFDLQAILNGVQGIVDNRYPVRWPR
jgi:hypothetical protein